MKQATGMRNLDVWYADVEVGQLFDPMKAGLAGKQRAKVQANVAKARTRDSVQTCLARSGR
jgi:hypothetical protein